MGCLEVWKQGSASLKVALVRSGAICRRVTGSRGAMSNGAGARQTDGMLGNQEKRGW